MDKNDSLFFKILAGMIISFAIAFFLTVSVINNSIEFEFTFMEGVKSVAAFLCFLNGLILTIIAYES